MSLSIIVAMTEERVIGKNNALPWHISADLKRFKQITMGHPIIMGRRTFESIGKPLPGRENVVLSRDSNFRPSGVRVVGSLCEALAACDLSTGEEFVIGGASIFRDAWPITHKIYLTLIHAKFEGDVYFPDFDLAFLKSVEKLDHLSETPPYSFITALLPTSHVHS